MICIYKLNENWDIFMCFYRYIWGFKIVQIFSWGSREGFLVCDSISDNSVYHAYYQSLTINVNVQLSVRLDI